MKTKKILMIDDSQTIRDGYEIIAMQLKKKYPFEFDIVGKADDALNRMIFSTTHPYDLVCIDIEFPASYDGSITSGEDLAQKMKEIDRHVKFLVITYHQKKERILHIYNVIQPHGFLLKSQSGHTEIQDAIIKILNGEKVLSHNVTKILYSLNASSYEEIDDIDRKILFYLDKHYTHQQIAEMVHKSLSTIDKRKKKLKSIFLIEEGADAELIHLAKEKGYLNLFID